MCPAATCNGGIADSDSASLYDALPGEQDSSARSLARDHVLAREALAQADYPCYRGIQTGRALHQDRLAVRGNLEHVKRSRFDHVCSHRSHTIAAANDICRKRACLGYLNFRTLEWRRQVPVFG